ncbi:MAG TPA: hypothetical protein VLV83_19030 [Acidobacteriota bacterium]|nr:hypothetical protein [Acidobacteriota bacterium]
MIRKSRVAIVFAMFISQLISGVIPGKWEKLGAQPEGTSVIVTMKSLDRFQGTWRGLEGDALKLESKDGQIRRLPRSGVQRVETPPDSLSNGMLAGGVTGGIVFGAIVAGLSQVEGFDAKNGLAVGAILVGIGVGAGALADAARPHHEILYEAP